MCCLANGRLRGDDFIMQYTDWLRIPVNAATAEGLVAPGAFELTG